MRASLSLHARCRVSPASQHSPVHVPLLSRHSAQRRFTVCHDGSDDSGNSTAPFNVLAKLASPAYLTQAARRYNTGLEAGISDDELLAFELGASSPGALTPIQAQYKDKLREKLDQRAEELRREEAEAQARLSRNSVLGQERYGRGEYSKAVEAFEQAVRDVGTESMLGGEAQLWLALSYQACGREADAIELFKSVEELHPSRKITKKAYELRYIMEAPKLPIREDERVKIPLLQSEIGRRKNTFVPKYTPPKKAIDPAKQTYWDRLDWRTPAGASLLPDQWYLRLLVVLLVVGTVVYLNLNVVPASH